MGSQILAACACAKVGDPQQQRESQNPTLALPDGQVQILGPGPGTERCNAALPQLNSDEKDTLVRVKFVHASGDLLIISMAFFLGKSRPRSLLRGHRETCLAKKLLRHCKTKSRKI